MPVAAFAAAWTSVLETDFLFLCILPRFPAPRFSLLHLLSSCAYLLPCFALRCIEGWAGSVSLFCLISHLSHIWILADLIADLRSVLSGSRNGVFAVAQGFYDDDLILTLPGASYASYMPASNMLHRMGLRE